MRRTTMLVLLSLTLVIPITAYAQCTLLCLSATPLIDEVRVCVEETDPRIPTYSVNSYLQRAFGLYDLRGSTSAGANQPIPDSFKFAVYAHNDTSFFGGNPDCRIAVTIIPPGLTGTAAMHCEGHPTNGPFNVTINLTPISCGISLPTVSAQQDNIFQIQSQHQLASDEDMARGTALRQQGMLAAGDEEMNETP